MTSNSEKCSHQRISYPVESIKCKIHVNASWSVLKVNWELSKQSQSNNTAYTIVRHYQGALSYVDMALLREQDKYPIGPSVPSGCSRKTTHPIAWSHASVSTEQDACKRGRSRTGGSTDITFSVSKALISSLSNPAKVFSWPLQIFLFNRT